MSILFKQLTSVEDCGAYLDAKPLNCHYLDDPYRIFDKDDAVHYIRRVRELKDFDMYSKSDWLGTFSRITEAECFEYALKYKHFAFHNSTCQFFRSLIQDKHILDYCSIGLLHFGEHYKNHVFTIPTMFWGLCESQPSIYLNGSEITNLFTQAKHACPRSK